MRVAEGLLNHWREKYSVYVRNGFFLNSRTEQMVATGPLYMAYLNLKEYRTLQHWQEAIQDLILPYYREMELYKMLRIRIAFTVREI